MTHDDRPTSSPASERARGSLAALAAHLKARGVPVETGKRLRQVYINRDKDDELLATFNEALVELLMTDRDGTRLEGRGIALIGPSGAGKSQCIKRLVATHGVFEEHGANKPDSRVLSVRCKGSCTLRVLGELLLKASGYELEDGLRENVVWQILQERLELLEILVVHIDEVSNLVENGSPDDHQRAINNLKALINDPDWPVLLVVSGTDMIRPILSKDTQLRRRVDWIEMGSLSAGEHNETIAAYLEALCRIGEVTSPDGLEEAIAPRLIHAACLQIGIAAEISIKAVEAAIVGGALSMEHFAIAYARRTGCAADQNPFVAEDYLSCDPAIAIVAEPGGQDDGGNEPKRRRRRRRRKAS